MADTKTENLRRGFWLRMARERAGISQATAARELGLSGQSKSTLSAWEAGTREPRPSMLSRMAILYVIPVERLMNPEPTAYETIDAWLSGSFARTTMVMPQVDADVVVQTALSGIEEGRRRARDRSAADPQPRSPSPSRPARGKRSEPARPEGQS